MVTTESWKQLNTFIADKAHILVTTHLNPDGDGLGSQIALAEYLKGTGKQVSMVNNGATPVFFIFMDPDNEIRVCSQTEPDFFDDIDGAIIVDISDWERLGDVGKKLNEKKIPIACIDHHIPTDIIGVLQILDQSVSSTGELIYQYLKHQQAQFTPRIVSSLYASILTDTGSFRFSNTTPETHRIAADLIEKGADYQYIYRQVYENHSKSRLHLTGILLTNMQYDCDDRLVWFILTRDLIREHKLEQWELEGLSELPRHLRDAEISIMFTECEQGVKVSLRSKGNIAINGLANLFGGGGHQFASGVSLKMDLPQALDTILNEARKLFNHR